MPPPRPPRRLLVIHNPTAGRRAAQRLARWLAHLADLGARVELQATEARGHAEALARAADPGRFDAVVAAGGDGTINEVVNGLGSSPLPLALLPLGTANVLAAELGIPSRGAAPARIAAAAPVRQVWPGEVVADGVTRRFMLMAGVGFDAEVIERLDLDLKRRIGRLAYAATILRRLGGVIGERYPALIDGAPVKPASLVAARSHFYGGRFVLAPEARLDGPRLQIVLFERAGRGAAVAYLGAMLSGTLARRADIRIVAADRVEIEGPAGAPVQIDGDVHARLPATIRVGSTPLAVIAPP